MDFELYTKRPFGESLAVEIISGAATATVACWGGRLLINKETHTLSPGRTVLVAVAGLVASWAATTVARRALMRMNP